MKKKKKKNRNRKKVDSLLKIPSDFILRQCKRSYDEKADQILNIKWHETSLFCLAFKIKAKLFTDCFYWSMCNPLNVKGFVSM